MTTSKTGFPNLEKQKDVKAMESAYSISLKSFTELAEKCQGDRENQQLLQMILESVEDYHRAIIRESTYYALHAQAAGDQHQFLEAYRQYDQSRSTAHNLMLQYINMLNNLARSYGLPYLYTGEISEKMPYRRQVADAALGLLEEIIRNRI